ncbi:MAG: GDP-L-fucose synthase family protein, partial [Candidatus Hodarchaeales archaeon]
GRHLFRELKNRGYNDIVSIGRMDVDLMDKVETKVAIMYHKPNIIIHAAAKCGGIGANRNSAATFFSENAIMNINVIEAAHNRKVWGTSGGDFLKFIGLGSVCAYPKYAPIPFKEDDIWNGYPEETNAPYGITKRMMQMQIQSYRQQWYFPGIFLIPVNLYGPGDNFDLEKSHVIPALIRKIDHAKNNNLDVELWGTGKASREFLYVEDAATGIVDAMEKYDDIRPVNLGTGKEITIKDLAILISDLIGFGGEIRWNHDMPDGQPRRCLDVSRAKELFGFEAKTSLKDGLKKTIEWYKELKANDLYGYKELKANDLYGDYE